MDHQNFEVYNKENEEDITSIKVLKSDNFVSIVCKVQNYLDFIKKI